MSWANVDPQITQLMTQLLFLQKQMINQMPQGIVPCPTLIGALEDFINQLGVEATKQAQ